MKSHVDELKKLQEQRKKLLATLKKLKSFIEQGEHLGYKAPLDIMFFKKIA